MEDSSVLQYQLITKNAQIPKRGSKLAAGFDLYSAYDIVIPPKSRGFVSTDVKIALPHGTYGRISARSGLALIKGIDVVGGVIDADYRGAIGVILFNHSDEEFTVKIGDRIAQLICEKIHYPKLVPVEKFDTTERNTNGFGSTGV